MSPTIKVWELENTNENYEGNHGGTVIAEFSGHKYSVNCVVSLILFLDSLCLMSACRHLSN